MNIRLAVSEDAPLILDLFKKLDTESSFMLFEPDERTTTVSEQLGYIEKFCGAPNWLMCVAESDSEIFAICVLMGGFALRSAHCANLSMGVAKEHWGMGVGENILVYALEQAKSIGITRVELTVHTTNTAAINLYKKLGFVLEGEKVHSLKVDGVFVNEYCMAKV
ncbi:MAG: GNAT family N-acetyltransferase [Agarilytica sp.]